MPEMKFEYQLRLGASRPEPLVNVLVYGPQDTEVVLAVVDSGAIRPIFPKQTAERVGLDVSGRANDWIQYGGGRTPAWRVRTRVGLGNERWDAQVSFVERLDMPYALLGREGIFARFKAVTFREQVRPATMVFSW